MGFWGGSPGHHAGPVAAGDNPGVSLGATLRILRLDVTSDSSVAEYLGRVPGGHMDVVGEEFGGIWGVWRQFGGFGGILGQV